jgi:hypothetical protein
MIICMLYISTDIYCTVYIYICYIYILYIQYNIPIHVCMYVCILLPAPRLGAGESKLTQIPFRQVRMPYNYNDFHTSIDTAARAFQLKLLSSSIQAVFSTSKPL